MADSSLRIAVSLQLSAVSQTRFGSLGRTAHDTRAQASQTLAARYFGAWLGVLSLG
jgi:hypothetical protein